VQEGRSGRGTRLKAGKCLWFEHSDETKYLSVCLRHAFKHEAEVVTEWRLYDKVSKQGRTIAPETLSHHVTECAIITRANITLLVQELDENGVVLERL